MKTDTSSTNNWPSTSLGKRVQRRDVYPNPRNRVESNNVAVFCRIRDLVMVVQAPMVQEPSLVPRVRGNVGMSVKDGPFVVEVSKHVSTV